MSRSLRIQYPDAWYHVMNRGRRGDEIFCKDKDYTTIYLMRRLRGDTLKAVGEVVGIKKNSTVSSIVDRVKYEMSRDKGIRLSVEKLVKSLSNGQTEIF